MIEGVKSGFYGGIGVIEKFLVYYNEEGEGVVEDIHGVWKGRSVEQFRNNGDFLPLEEIKVRVSKLRTYKEHPEIEREVRGSTRYEDKYLEMELKLLERGLEKLASEHV